VRSHQQSIGRLTIKKRTQSNLVSVPGGNMAFAAIKIGRRQDGPDRQLDGAYHD
jgi:hypothetical protein